MTFDREAFMEALEDADAEKLALLEAVRGELARCEAEPGEHPEEKLATLANLELVLSDYEDDRFTVPRGF